MTLIEHYLVAAAVIFGVNLLPAFAPPTWAVLVFFLFSFDLGAVILVPIGAVAATLGRLALAWTSRRVRPRLARRRLASLDAIRAAVTGGRIRAFTGLGLFLLSPLPSNQLFIAAGLMALPLGPLGLAFCVGRLVSYSVYLNGAVLARATLGDLFIDQLNSPIAVAVQLVTLAALGLLLAVDWERILAGRLRGAAAPGTGEPAARERPGDGSGAPEPPGERHPSV